MIKNIPADLIKEVVPMKRAGSTAEIAAVVAFLCSDGASYITGASTQCFGGNYLMTVTEYDVIVAGSGPAGSTAATLLAQQDHKVLILERGKHPRFHIGESMLPLSTPVFDRLGIKWDKNQYLHKNGAEFIDEHSGKQMRFSLSGQYQPYQVERARFDHMLINNAVSHGASLQQEESVTDVDIDADGVQVTTDLGQYSDPLPYRCNRAQHSHGQKTGRHRTHREPRPLCTLHTLPKCEQWQLPGICTYLVTSRS